MSVENKNTRKQYRLPNYDYSQNGAYFITICIKNKQPILSKIVVGTSSARPKLVQLTKIGAIVDKGIRGINQHYENVFVDNYVIMPNHIHLLIRIQNDNAQITPVPTISRIIQQFKGYVTKQVGKPIWQEKSYDHVIRDDYDYMVRYQYIDDNPAKWINNKNLP
jgi:REP element-mobilizing transposase RayT